MHIRDCIFRARACRTAEGDGICEMEKGMEWICILVISVLLDDIVELEHALIVGLQEGVTVPASDSR